MSVGVLDYTHEALSSFHLFYNPKFEFLNPGTLAALKEIEYIKKIAKDYDEKFKFYYLGLYFQDCQKSVYKANYKPSQVACPYTSNFVYLTEAVKKAIKDKKKPKLYELVKSMKEDQDCQESVKDCDRIKILPESGYSRLADDQAKNIVMMSFRIVYQNKFVIGIEHL